MSSDPKQEEILDQDASEGKKAEKDTAVQKKSALRMLQIQEEDLATQKSIREERLETMRWLRRARNIVAIVATVIPIALLAWLLAALTNPCVGRFFYDNDVNMWAKVAVISGTFLTFIFVFGGLVKGIFSSSRNEDDKDSKFEELARLAAENFGEKMQ